MVKLFADEGARSIACDIARVEEKTLVSSGNTVLDVWFVTASLAGKLMPASNSGG